MFCTLLQLSWTFEWTRFSAVVIVVVALWCTTVNKSGIVRDRWNPLVEQAPALARLRFQTRPYRLRWTLVISIIAARQENGQFLSSAMTSHNRDSATLSFKCFVHVSQIEQILCEYAKAMTIVLRKARCSQVTPITWPEKYRPNASIKTSVK